jgi:hypothetical protein
VGFRAGLGWIGAGVGATLDTAVRNRTFRNTGGKPAEWLAVRTPAVP